MIFAKNMTGISASWPPFGTEKWSGSWTIIALVLLCSMTTQENSPEITIDSIVRNPEKGQQELERIITYNNTGDFITSFLWSFNIIHHFVPDSW